ncbi:hypothetical protein B0O80DRAFT_499756 [Mortierella sp. GBAus27b]|nr:hypothetical protein BGX31_008580 [Mortierella sp. GBA43]KAI8351838.1 hypothetical protein B0O80DRAFT_499756 [Mortierella sp. GBAus27b]
MIPAIILTMSDDGARDSYDRDGHLELVTLLDGLDQSIRELEKAMATLQNVHENIRVSKSLRLQSKNDMNELEPKIAERKMQALACRLAVMEMEATRLDQQNWASY